MNFDLVGLLENLRKAGWELSIQLSDLSFPRIGGERQGYLVIAKPPDHTVSLSKHFLSLEDLVRQLDLFYQTHEEMK